tara:strand:- start:590 stop:1858 length:1269 start_codon:yes stop_codon:yes gene_type:complete
MANNLVSNTQATLSKSILDRVESTRTISKTVNTQFLGDAINSNTGDTVFIKRPGRFKSSSTTDGDISGTTANSIIAGKAKGVVQNFITVEVDWSILEEATQLNQLNELVIEPMCDEIVTTLETRFGEFAMKNCNLSVGTPGQAIDAWGDVAKVAAMVKSMGFPSGERTLLINPFSQVALSEVQRSIGAADGLVNPAFKDAVINSNFAGMRVMTSDSLTTFTSGANADRVGAIVGTPVATYVAAKDTMTQSITLNGLTNNGTIKAGEVIEVTGKYYLNQSTRLVIMNGAAPVKWRGVVTADATINGSGEVTLIVAGPAIKESTEQYDTVDAGLAAGDVVTLLHATGTLYQPNMFYHKNAYSIGSVPLPKLSAQDVLMKTKDGLQLRMSRGSSLRENKQILRIDMLPAFAVLNPFLCGQAYGNV